MLAVSALSAAPKCYYYVYPLHHGEAQLYNQSKSCSRSSLARPLFLVFDNGIESSDLVRKQQTVTTSLHIFERSKWIGF